MEITDEDRKDCVVRKTFEDLADVRDPKGAFEAGADFFEAL
jgi:hypothetical protein